MCKDQNFCFSFNAFVYVGYMRYVNTEISHSPNVAKKYLGCDLCCDICEHGSQRSKWWTNKTRVEKNIWVWLNWFIFWSSSPQHSAQLFHFSSLIYWYVPLLICFWQLSNVLSGSNGYSRSKIRLWVAGELIIQLGTQIIRIDKDRIHPNVINRGKHTESRCVPSSFLIY